MNHSVGDCVKNTVKKSYNNGDVIEKETSGNVLKVYTLSISYLVLFNGAAMPHRILETHLTGC